MAGHIGRACENVRKAQEPVIADCAENKAGINAEILILDPLHVHGKGAVDQDHRLLERAALPDHSEKVCLALVKGQHRNSLRVLHVKVNAFSSVAGKKDKGHIGVIIKACLYGIRVKAYRHLADGGIAP